MSRQWLLRIIGAFAMVAVVHAFMLGFKVPTPEAWYLGAIIYAALVAVLFSKRSIIDKLGIYVVFAVVTIVGALTVCPCTGAQFVATPLAGLATLGIIHRLKRLLRRRPGTLARPSTNPTTQPSSGELPRFREE